MISALAQSGLAPQRLELEITESALLADTAATAATLHALRRFGVRIALDDFGTGYSSLSYLRGFPFDKIKIDRSFVKDLAERRDCTAIVTAISSLARSLGIATTAEGVETAEQLDFLRAAGLHPGAGLPVQPGAAERRPRRAARPHQRRRSRGGVSGERRFRDRPRARFVRSVKRRVALRQVASSFVKRRQAAA